MGILFRYILREVLITSLIGTLLFTFVLFLRLIDPLMELLVRPGASSGQVFYLLALTLPEAVRLTTPIGVLVGVLVGLGRLSTDGEITAMRSAGIPGRRCARPVAVFALAGAALCAAMTLWVNPLAKREIQRISESLKISQATAEVQPRVFIERFSDAVVWVQDVIPGGGAAVRWKGVFLADMRAPSERGSFGGVNAAVDGPRVTVAEEAVVVPRPEQQRLQIHLPHASTYEQSYDPTQYHSFEFFDSDQVLEISSSRVVRAGRPFEQRSAAELWSFSGPPRDRTPAAIELHQRLALPFACLALPMVGISLAISSQRSTRSLGVIFSIVLVFIYYMTQLGGIALAERSLLPAAVGVWLANLMFGVVGAVLLAQLDRPNRRDITAAIAARARTAADFVRRLGGGASVRRLPLPVVTTGNGRPGRGAAPSPLPRSASLPVLPIIDRYVLRTFLFYFAVLVAAFVMIWCVFSFFELLTDMLTRNKLALFVPYIYYLTPFLVYKTAPLGVLVATLVSFGILAKHQELTAFKACGISLFRLSVPILVCSVGVSGLLFGLDHYYLPETNRKQDAIRDEIKGRPSRTFLRPDRQWTYGLKDRIFFHRFFDTSNRVLVEVNVFDFAPDRFALRRHIFAKRAVWNAAQHAWVLKEGWVREVRGSEVTHFEQFQSRSFPDLEEDPGYFLKEVRQHQQMNWPQLRSYILELAQSGFNTVRLQVELHRKLAFPLFAFVIAVLAIPFSFLADHRGALTGVALSIGLAIAYYAINALFEQLGRANQLTPMMAAWAPSVLFGLSGAYLFLRVRS